MANELTFWPSEIAREHREGIGLDEPVDRVTVALLDEDEEVIAEQELELPEDGWSEYADPDGNLQWDLTPQPLSLTLPEDARTALVSWGGGAEAVRLEVQSSEIPEPLLWPRSVTDAGFTIHVLSERFDDHQQFWHACDQFADALGADPAFAPALDAGRMGLVGAFWPSDPDVGLFDSRDHGVRRWYGDHARALRYSARVGAAQLVLVAINRPEWGGAGGIMFQRPAWSTVFNFDDRWPAMALHELGHAFGLADEYEDPGPNIPFDDDIPNVTRRRNALQAPWSGDISDAVRPNHLDPTQRHDQPDIWDTDTIGTFEGAFYSDRNFYRPSPECRMRHTNQPFCAVCARHIQTRMQQHGG